MTHRVRLAILSLLIVATTALSACGTGSSKSSSDDEVASMRQAGTEANVELCIATGHLQTGDPELSVIFIDFPPPDGARRTYDPMSLDMDRCLTGPGGVQAQIVGSSIYVSVLSRQSITDPPWNISITCDGSTPESKRYRRVMDPFDIYRTPSLCSGKTIEAYRYADSKGTVEFNVNIGF